MDWETKDKERKQKLAEEKARLLAMTDAQAEKLPVPERYTRIRYLREIFAAEWLERERRKIPAAITEPKKTMRYYGKSTKIVYERD